MLKAGLFLHFCETFHLLMINTISIAKQGKWKIRITQIHNFKGLFIGAPSKGNPKTCNVADVRLKMSQTTMGH